MSHFAMLYKLAHRILTAPRESDMGKLSMHSGHTDAEAEAILHQAILQATMPGERGDAPWAVVRVFMRNLVNRAFAPVTGTDMVELLAGVEADIDEAHFEQRVELLSNRVAERSLSLASSLNTLRTVEPVAGQGYIEWLMQRVAYYAALTVDQLEPERVVADVRVIASESQTRIPNIGVALAANLLADLGAPSLAKPDKHVLLTILALMPAGSRPDPEMCIRKIIDIAKQEAPVLMLDPDFRWLSSGLQPRHLDRLVYLIGSDNFLLNGKQNKRWAPIRRQLMWTVLKGEGVEPDEVISSEPPVSLLSLGRGPEANVGVDQIGTHEDDGGCLDANAEVMFYDMLDGNEAAQRFLAELIDLAANEGCEIHYTFTDDADIRIRAFRDRGKTRQQNVVVLTWRPTKRWFASKLFAPTDFCHEVGLSTAQSQPRASSPLPTKVFLDPANEAQVVAFGLAALRSIRDFRDMP